MSRRRVTAETVQALQLLVAGVALIWGVTTLWIQHNRRVFGGRPDRRQRRTSRLELSPQDALGRRVEIGGEVDLRAAVYVEISLDGSDGTKCFATFDAAPQRDQEQFAEPHSPAGGAA